MILAVIGSRELHVDLDNFISQIPGVTGLISGGARGIDSNAEAYAKTAGIPIRVIKPDYDRFGRSAPLVRDRQIVDEADMVLALWDGSSRGTAYTVNYAHKKGVPVKLYRLRRKDV